DTPYISFLERDENDKASVMKFAGNQWTYVGSPAFTSDSLQTVSLEFGKNDTLFLHYKDKKGFRKFCYFDGSVWVYPNSLIQNTRDSLFAVDSSGTVYTGFKDPGNFNIVTIKKWS